MKVHNDIDAAITFNFTSKDALASALEAKRRAAKRIDARSMREMAKAKDAVMKRVNRQIAKAKKEGWGYDEWAAADFGFPLNYSERCLSCPNSIESELDRALSLLETTTQKQWSISRHGKNDSLWRLLALDAKPVRNLCAPKD